MLSERQQQVLSVVSVHRQSVKEEIALYPVTAANINNQTSLVPHSLCSWPPPRCRWLLTASGAAAVVLTFCSGWLVGWGTADKTIHRFNGCFLLCLFSKKKYWFTTISRRWELPSSFTCLLFSVFRRHWVEKRAARAAVLVSCSYDTDTETQRSRQVESGKSSTSCEMPV